ncbi:TonB-dependent receptor plug domain-containing protein [Flavobacterium aquidurense]|uniref:TonB-dependent receptor n=1 Tax=Flavobacterium aquidurense TaxID=362413 RepID=UPI00285C46C3|nr:TonB-dependent receptor plug domain-containing protein [Flavobacterium aquidurense]MDR7371141.1 Ca-activated chloride channel family protein [Flavobacterium aquidurense]
MKNVKIISLGIAMFISVITRAQEKTSSDTIANATKVEISPVKVSPNFVQPASTAPNGRVVICAPSRSNMKEPLYVLDGVQINSKQVAKINPNDIESIKVLKGVEATSIYGSHGRNGVVIITSKEEE